MEEKTRNKRNLKRESERTYRFLGVRSTRFSLGLQKAHRVKNFQKGGNEMEWGSWVYKVINPSLDPTVRSPKVAKDLSYPCFGKWNRRFLDKKRQFLSLPIHSFIYFYFYFYFLFLFLFFILFLFTCLARKVFFFERRVLL